MRYGVTGVEEGGIVEREVIFGERLDDLRGASRSRRLSTQDIVAWQWEYNQYAADI